MHRCKLFDVSKQNEKTEKNEKKEGNEQSWRTAGRPASRCGKIGDYREKEDEYQEKRVGTRRVAAPKSMPSQSRRLTELDGDGPRNDASSE